MRRLVVMAFVADQDVDGSMGDDPEATVARWKSSGTSGDLASFDPTEEVNIGIERDLRRMGLDVTADALATYPASTPDSTGGDS